METKENQNGREKYYSSSNTPFKRMCEYKNKMVVLGHLKLAQANLEAMQNVLVF